MKKLISILLCLSMLLGFSCIAQAESIDFNETISGVISENQTENKYDFELHASGSIQIKLNAENMRRISIKIYDDAGQEVWNNTPYWNDTSKQISFSENIELTSGKYTIILSRYDGNGTYEFCLSYEDSEESFEEEQNGSNNTFKSASDIDVDENYVGQIAINDETDIYKFTLDNSGRIGLSLNAENMRRVNMKFYDNDGQEIWNNTPYWNDTSKRISFSENIEFTSGIYYFSVSRYDGNGTYEFCLSYEDSEESFEEEQNGSNNTFKSASDIDVDENYVGQIAINDKTDIYKFTLDNSGRIGLSLNAENMRRVNMKFYDNNGQEIWNNTPYWNDTSKRISFSEDVTLTEGTYYFSVSKYDGYGTYEFSLNTDNSLISTAPSDIDNPIEDYDTDEVINGDEITSFDSKVSEWAKEEVEEAYENDLIPDTIIGEDLTEHITRAEFAAIAVQLYEELSGIYAPSDETPFVDVDWNENVEYINKAYVLGITSGTSKTTFEPNIDITREQLATMLCRTVKKYSFDGWTLENDSDYYLDTNGVSRFADDNEISDYAKPSVYYMAKFGIINGVGNNKFAPRNITSYQEATGYATATREQAILMSLRIFNVSEIW